MPPRLLSIAEARERVLAATSPLPSQPVALLDAIGRVLARDVVAAGDTPPFPSSAMDGYAVEAGPAGRELEVVGESRAGAPWTEPFPRGQALRISTGAVVPAGAEAVIRQEDTEHRNGRVLIGAEVKPGQNVRQAGEDMRTGTRVLTAGTTIGPAELGTAVAAGAADLEVGARPRVRVLCTGDELVEPGAPLRPGQIHNSNGPMLVALARAAGATAPAAARLPDDREATIAALEEALEEADLVVVSGGVSVGPHDHVKPALAALGVSEQFWGVALQPGKPTWFGLRGDKLVFGLPGNPVSTYVTFRLFVRPALGALQGRHTADAVGRGRLAQAVRRNPVRDQAIRVRLAAHGGTPEVEPNGPQGSHVVTSLVGADALAIIPQGNGELAAGELVDLLGLHG
jgi:molybdopterin molybdotransferase